MKINVCPCRLIAVSFVHLAPCVLQPIGLQKKIHNESKAPDVLIGQNVVYSLLLLLSSSKSQDSKQRNSVVQNREMSISHNYLYVN